MQGFFGIPRAGGSSASGEGEGHVDTWLIQEGISTQTEVTEQDMPFTSLFATVYSMKKILPNTI